MKPKSPRKMAQSVLWISPVMMILLSAYFFVVAGIFPETNEHYGSIDIRSIAAGATRAELEALIVSGHADTAKLYVSLDTNARTMGLLIGTAFFGLGALILGSLTFIHYDTRNIKAAQPAATDNAG